MESPKTNENTSTLETELKRLSLEATADRHLGPSSGLSFAKLTQAVLRRLCPDQEAFVFASEAEGESEEANDIYWGDQGLNHDWSGMGMDLGMDLGVSLPLDSSPLDSTSSSGQSRNQTRMMDSLHLPDILDIPPATSSDASDLSLINPAHINHLLGFYFAHSHTLYPIIRQHELTRVLWQLYADPQDPLAQSPLWMFRIWMVLAIGSTAYCSVARVEESESMRLFNKAMTHFEAVMSCGELVSRYGLF